VQRDGWERSLACHAASTDNHSLAEGNVSSARCDGRAPPTNLRIAPTARHHSKRSYAGTSGQNLAGRRGRRLVVSNRASAACLRRQARRGRNALVPQAADTSDAPARTTGAGRRAAHGSPPWADKSLGASSERRPPFFSSLSLFPCCRHNGGFCRWGDAPPQRDRTTPRRRTSLHRRRATLRRHRRRVCARGVRVGVVASPDTSVCLTVQVGNRREGSPVHCLNRVWQDAHAKVRPVTPRTLDAQACDRDVVSGVMHGERRTGTTPAVERV
jgi:hypothetical protein